VAPRDLFLQGNQGIERSQGGLGLGLTIVRSLVEMHGGRVSAESEVGRGSTFVVSLPAAPPLRVLVVDDNQDAADMMGLALEETTSRRPAPSPRRRRRASRSRARPEVGLLDIGLPVMDGYELARRVRAGAELPALLVAITGYGQEDDRRRSAAAGFDAHLVKPIGLDDVTALLDDWATHRATHPAIHRPEPR
jgi:CheY-like chemotaxis protein